MTVRDRRVDGVHEVHEEGLVRLDERVADDLDIERLCRLSGQERERALAGPVVDLRDRRPVRRGVIDGDRLLACSRKAHGEPRVRVSRVPLDDGCVTDRDLDPRSGQDPRPLRRRSHGADRGCACERKREAQADDQGGKKAIHARAGMTSKNNRNAPLAARIAKPVVTSRSP